MQVLTFLPFSSHLANALRPCLTGSGGVLIYYFLLIILSRTPYGWKTDLLILLITVRSIFITTHSSVIASSHSLLKDGRQSLCLGELEY